MPHAPAQLAKCVERKRLVEGAGQRTENLPVLTGFAGRKDSSTRQLNASLGIDVGAVLFDVGSPRQDDVGVAGATVAVMSLIDYECPAKVAGVDLVGAQQVENLDIARFAPGENAAEVAPARSRSKPEIKPSDPRGGIMQDIEPVPVVANQAAALGYHPCRRQHLGAVRPRQRPLSEHDHRVFRVAQPF